MISFAIGLVGAVLVLIWEIQRKAAVNAKETLAAELAAETEQRKADVKRLSAVIEAKREESERLMNEINSCGSPESVSSLAKRLLSNPWD